MKNVIFILFLLTLMPLYSQSNDKEMYQKAFDFYNIKQYDSAYYYFNLDKKKDVYSHSAFGKINYILGDFEKAKQNLILALSDTIEVNDLLSIKHSACLTLADIYLTENNHKKALNYLKLSKYKHPKFIWCTNMWHILDKIDINYKIAQCFNELSEIDSAIHYLTPYMFLNHKDYPSIDSLEFLAIQDFYISILYKRYTKDELQNYMKKGLDNLVFTKEVDSVVYFENQDVLNRYVEVVRKDSILVIDKPNHDSVYQVIYEIDNPIILNHFKIDCNFTFIDLNIFIEKGKTVSEYNTETKDSYIEELKSSYTYKSVMNK